MTVITVRLRFLSIRHSAALSVTVLGTEAAMYGAGALPAATRAGGSPAPAPGMHVFALVLGLMLLALIPGLWRGTRTAVALSIACLAALATLDALHDRLTLTVLQGGVALMLTLALGAFRLGSTNRPARGIAGTALAAWGLTLAAVLVTPLFAGIAHVLRHPAAHRLAADAPADWRLTVDVLVGAALATTLLALRSLIRPAAATNRPDEHEYRTARAIIDHHGADSLSPFLLRPDKALSFAAGGVLSYRVIGGTAVVSGDPVGPAGSAGAVVENFRERARRNGWDVVLWAAGPTHLPDYARQGLRALCVGEEAFVDPRTFTLEGRPVRKLRQSVNRVARRGWEVTAREGRAIDEALEAEIDALDAQWNRDHPQVHGFAMSMGVYGAQLRADDLYLLARSPTGELGAVMRFVTCGDCLSLDTMQRVGSTPNGLNEALVAGALRAARERGVAEVSLNYAGLAHLVRREPAHGRAARALTRLVLAPLHRRFQMDRLVRFNEKFSPTWRPRYLVYESRAGLPRAIVRVLQAEGYLPQPARTARERWAQILHPLRTGAAARRPRTHAALSDPR